MILHPLPAAAPALFRRWFGTKQGIARSLDAPSAAACRPCPSCPYPSACLRSAGSDQPRPLPPACLAFLPVSVCRPSLSAGSFQLSARRCSPCPHCLPCLPSVLPCARLLACCASLMPGACPIMKRLSAYRSDPDKTQRPDRAPDINRIKAHTCRPLSVRLSARLARLRHSPRMFDHTSAAARPGGI